MYNVLHQGPIQYSCIITMIIIYESPLYFCSSLCILVESIHLVAQETTVALVKSAIIFLSDSVHFFVQFTPLWSQLHFILVSWTLFWYVPTHQHGHMMHRNGGGDIWDSTALRWRHNERDAIVSQITSLTIVYSSVNSGADQRKH